MTTPQGDAQRTEIENQIKNNFDELKNRLDILKNEVQTESDETKKQEKEDEIQRLEGELAEIKALIDTLSLLQEQDLESLKTRLESLKNAIQSFRGEMGDLAGEIQEGAERRQETLKTPTTYELLKDSETCSRLLNIISSNPDSFKDVPGETAEKKLEYIFEKIRNSIVLFMKNKLGKSENIEKVINNTIAPAFEWSLMELLKKQGNETNVGMLQGIDSISWNGLEDLFNGVKGFADKFSSSYSQFNQWMNAVDYLSVHNGVLRNPSQSQVLSNPLKFKEYMNDGRFSAKDFSPYATISDNIFQIDDNQTFEFGITPAQQQTVLEQIGNIQVVNSPTTTALIARMLDKPEQFLGATSGLQATANGLLDGVNSLNSVTKIFGVDILGEISQSGEKSFVFRILDFVCKLIGITGGLEGIVKKWRMDRMNLTDEKNENIGEIFKKYKELAGESVNLNITDENSCKTALNDFAVTDPQNTSSTKGDFLRDSMVEKMDVSLISPAVVQQILGDSYLKKETVTENGETKEKIVVDEPKFTETDKLRLAHSHLIIMKTHLEKYNDNELSGFYTNIHSTEDLALCITASLYVDKDDVIEGVKAKVFLPENYGSVRSDGTVNNPGNTGRENLDAGVDASDKQKVSEQRIYDKAKEYGITDNRQIAYVLSTIKGECGFKNQKEIGGENRAYGKVDSTTGKAYYGRGFIQLTHKSNYEKYTQIIRNSGKDFKDNDGNTLKGSEIDLVNNPDVILTSNDLAIFIAMDWMKNGGPDRLENKKLWYYINDTKTDYYNARIIINGMSSKPQEYADNALAYQNKLGNGSVDSPIESDDLLIGPKLLAHNKDEIGGLGNSIMNGFQGLDDKTNFPNMDGVVGKSTVTHPRRFESQNDVLAYKNTHPNIKSFMFYFGANTRDNNKTLSDIKQRSEWLQAEGIQPVLCTSVGEDKQTWLGKLNQSLISLGREKNWPVLDFAKSYNKGDIALSSDGVHPTSYSSMTDIINGQLSQA